MPYLAERHRPRDQDTGRGAEDTSARCGDARDGDARGRASGADVEEEQRAKTLLYDEYTRKLEEVCPVDHCAVCLQELSAVCLVEDFTESTGCAHVAHATCLVAMASLGADADACPACPPAHRRRDGEEDDVGGGGGGDGAGVGVEERPEVTLERRVVRGYLRVRRRIEREEERDGGGPDGTLSSPPPASSSWGRLHERDARAVDDALSFWRRCAEAGDAQGQYNLGLLALRGHGVRADPKSALLWLRKAAQQGHLAAACECGLLLRTLRACHGGAPPSVPGGAHDVARGAAAGDALKDATEGIEWLRAAALQGSARAQGALGAIHEAGEPPLRRPDYAEALRWHRLAANQGHAASQYFLGALIYSGKGGKGKKRRGDVVDALGWFRLAAGQGHETARRSVRICERKLREAAEVKTGILI